MPHLAMPGVRGLAAGVAAAKASGAQVAIVGGHVPADAGHFALQNYL